MQYLTKRFITQKTDASSPTRARSGKPRQLSFLKAS